jgi:cytochrome c-type biogenesis protein CcmH
MSPQMVLSKFARVTIGARISKSGTAMPASGDLQGLVTPVSTQNSKLVQLTIDSKVP